MGSEFGFKTLKFNIFWGYEEIVAFFFLGGGGGGALHNWTIFFFIFFFWGGGGGVISIHFLKAGYFLRVKNFKYLFENA